MTKATILPSGKFLGLDGDESHFHMNEFRCKCGMCNYTDVADRLIMVLEQIRVASGPLHIVSSIRCPMHNANVGGAPQSFHMPKDGIGRAAGVSSRVMNPETLAILGARYLGPEGGIGLYHSWVHFDVREGRAFWEGT